MEKDWGMSLKNVLINASHNMTEVALRLTDRGELEKAKRLYALRVLLDAFIEEP